MATPTLKGNDGKPFTITINQFRGGTKTLLDESRTPKDSVTVSTNMMLDQDGVWVPRPGSAPYGQTLTGPVDGMGRAIKYNSDGSITSLLLVIDNGSLKTSQDGGAWTTVSGKTWTTGKPAQLTQINSRVYITNGVDRLAYYDVNLGTIVTYTALSTPAAPTLGTRGGTLASGSYNIYYKITAVKNGLGETAAGPEVVIAINKQRDAWLNNSTTQDTVSITWTAVTGADRYNIYYSDQSGQEVYLDSSTSNNYLDNGIAQPNLYQVAPVGDSTAGPILGTLSLSGNRVWGTGDPSNPYRVYWTSATAIGSFDPFQGGGYVDLNLGSDEKPQAIQHYRTGKGDAVAVVLTSNPVGGGSVWFCTLSTIQVDTVSGTIPQVTSQGSIGTNSPRGVVQANNNIYYPSIKGFQQLGSQAAVLNVLTTSEISAVIRPNVRAINNSAAANISGIYYQGRVFWAVPYGSTSNNQVWVLDLERQAWCIAWSIAVKQFLEYPDSSGVSHLLAIPVNGTKLIEFSQSTGGDSGVGFNVDLESGLIYWDNDHSLWARIDKVYVEFGRPKGNVQFGVSGTQKGKTLSLLKSISITDTVSNSGLGTDMFGDFEFGDTNNAPSTFSQSSVKKRLLIRKRLNNIKWSVTSSDVNAYPELLEVIIKGKILSTSDPTSWK